VPGRAAFRRLLSLTAVTLLAVLLSSCSALDDGSFKVEDALSAEGFASPAVDHSDAGAQGAVLYVSYDSDETKPTAIQAEAERAVRLVWERAPFRLAKVDVEANHPSDVDVPPTMSFTDEALQERFGARDPSLDRLVRGDAASGPSGVLEVVAVAGLMLVILVVAVVVVILVVLRQRKASTRGAAQRAGWAPPGSWPPPPSADQYGGHAAYGPQTTYGGPGPYPEETAHGDQRRYGAQGPHGDVGPHHGQGYYGGSAAYGGPAPHGGSTSWAPPQSHGEASSGSPES
jgi:hypothetical protein